MDVAVAPGYTFLERVQEGDEFTLFRGRRDEDSLPVLIRIPASEYPSAVTLEKIEWEFSLRAELDPDWAATPLSLVRDQGRLALILQDPGGTPLDSLRGRTRMLSESLRLALGLTRVLAKVHGRNLIHKDVKPANVLFNPDTGEVNLMGFGIASRLPREHQAPDPPQVINGTLAYMAPEQTGRMNRSLDSRSDLYSLGVSLYELLTGSLPFAASDPMEWVHCHVARQPIPPREVAAGEGIPHQVSNLVLKLLAKMAEERYQTAEGVEADLSRCLKQWESQGRIEAFPLGERDASSRLLIPEKLYGREREIQALLASFGRVAEQGACELALVSGYSGVGKSSLVSELHKAIVWPRGLYASGKFDQYKRNIPYDTLAQAFRKLVRQILAKSEEEAAGWRQAIMGAISPNGQVMVDIVPELELLIGTQPPVPELSPQEAQNRFHAVFRQFLAAFARKEHPLVLFLDDLQWLDTASLKLLEHLITHPEVRHLLLIGAYRNNEVNPSHPLMLTLEAIRKTEVRMEELVLIPLSLRDVGLLLTDALRCGYEYCVPLAQLVHRKTEGNPFFTIRFLSTLYEEHLLEFDAEATAWRWDIERIGAKGFSENVVDLMVDKLRRLPKEALDALKIFACLGNAADSATLARVYEKTGEEVNRFLWEALRAEFILRLGDAYRFQHDRIQEAAYSLIPEPMRAGEHLRIGRLLVGGMSTEALEEEVFSVAGQFNRGIALISDAGEKDFVRRLNLLAGRKAKAAIAYSYARDYLAQAMALLPADAWRAGYEEAYSLSLELSECEYLVGRFEAADSLFNQILDHARSNPDRAKVFHLRVRLYQVAGRFNDAMRIGLEGLKLFGVTLPDSREELEAVIAAEFQAVSGNLGGRRASDLLDAPVASDPDARAAIPLIAGLTAPAYIMRSEAYPLLVLKGLNLSLRYGNTEESCQAYAFYALFLSGIFNDIQAAWEFSELALRLNEKFKDAKLKGTLLLMHGSAIRCW